MFSHVIRTFHIALLLLTLVCPQVALAHQEPGRGYGTETSLEFVANQNQWESAVKYSAALPGGRLFLKQNQWLFSFLDQSQLAGHGAQAAAKTDLNPEFIPAHAYTVTFLKANNQAELQPVNPTPGFRNYFLGNDPDKWASNVKAYEEIEYKALYP